MSTNSKNKNLIKINDSIFLKIKRVFLSLFKRKEKNSEQKNELITISKEIEKNNSNTNFLNSLRNIENENTKIYNLQKKYENGKLKISELSDEEYVKLENLYNNQIEKLISQIKYAKSKLKIN